MQAIFSTLAARLGRLLGVPRRLLASGVGDLRGVFQVLVAASFCWFVVSSLWIYPHSLSYANELVGGPARLPEHLLGSAVDWGQDLRYLEWWLPDRPQTQVVRVHLLHPAFLKSFVLRIENRQVSRGSRAFDNESKNTQATSAVSVNRLQHPNTRVFINDGSRHQLHADLMITVNDDALDRNLTYSIVILR